MKRLLVAALLASTLTVMPATAEASPYRCPQWEHLIVRHAPAGGWDIGRMSYICWRESRGLPWVRSTTRDTGLWQINDVNIPYLTRTLGKPVSIEWLKKPRNNAKAAAALCTYWRRAVGNCYQPWGM